MYHKPSAEPNVLAFISDHPQHVFGNVVQSALTRAVRYSSTCEAFENERRYIKLILSYNGSVSAIYQFNIFSLHLQIYLQVPIQIHRKSISVVFHGIYIDISILTLCRR